MSKILCSTGALIGRPNGRDYRLLESFVPQLHCDGFEFMMYDSWYGQTDALIEVLRGLKLHIPVMHCEKSIGDLVSIGGEENSKLAKEKFTVNCEMARELSANKMVIHLWNGMPSDLTFENNLKAYAWLNGTAQRYGIELLVENVVCNLHDPMRHWCKLYKAYPDVKFIFDTKMAAFHGQLGLLYQPEYDWLWKEGHICHYHVNDYAGGIKDWENLRTLPVGKGKIDFSAFFAHIVKIGYADTFTVEATAFDKNGKVDIDMLNEQFAYLREHLNG